MPLDAFVGETTVLTATFRSFSSETHTLEIEDPVTVTFVIYEYPLAASPVEHVPSQTPTKVSTGIYEYEWTPTTTGTYLARFEGVFADSTTDRIDQDFLVSETSTIVTPPGEALITEVDIFLASGLDPLYLAPEELSPLFPDATMLEIAEFIFIYSSEIKELYDLGDDEVPDYLGLDYIKAAAACDLTKIHEITGGDELSIKLGDFSITSRSFPKSALNRGTANTWCELAAALRNEILHSKTSPREVVPTSDYTSPIPARQLRRAERPLQ